MQENNGQLANLMEAPNKERYSSVDKQSQEVTNPTAHGAKNIAANHMKAFAKAGKKGGNSANIRQI